MDFNSFLKMGVRLGQAVVILNNRGVFVINNEKAKKILTDILRDISYPTSAEALERFSSLRDVDAKVREVKMVLGSLQGGAIQVLSQMEKDEGFMVNSRRVRLETLTNYCKTVIRFLNTGIIEQDNPVILPPDFSRLTSDQHLSR